MKYKVGDRVRIKSIDWYNANKDEYGVVLVENGNYMFCKSDIEWCGKIVTIAEVCLNEYYKIVEDFNKYRWTDEMIEGLVEEKIGTALNPVELKSNANCLTQERVDEMSLDKAGQITDFEYEGLAYTLPDGYQFVDENGNVINATKIVLEKKKKEYPKTYEECCKVLNTTPQERFQFDFEPYGEELYNLHRLLVCRDAYWKLYGEEMGLGKPWEPDYTDPDQDRYAIANFMENIEKSKWDYAYSITFVFPTKEMRDAFYENFKELINSCKELL